MLRRILAAMAMCSAWAIAGDYELLTYTPTGVTTASTVVAESKSGISGIPRYITFVGSTNMKWKVETVSGYGLSFNAARTIRSVVTNASYGAIVTNAMYLHGDRIKASFYSASGTTNTPQSATLKVLIEEP